MEVHTMTIPVFDQNTKDDIVIRSYTLSEYVDHVTSFHGYAAPGVIIGGFMVDLAYRCLPEESLFDVLCETPKCLPDAIQLLTPCTTGNGWLTVVNVGRFALSLYDKKTGEGIRVFVDPVKINEWPEVKTWFFKLKPKKGQDYPRLIKEISEARADICGFQTIRVADRFLRKSYRKEFVICPGCGEAYPIDDGPLCLGCREPLWEASGDLKSKGPPSPVK
jgi:formylmethanofuran dehydrogenase subunit E